MKDKPIITANTLINLLTARHKKDVFVAECKLGSTWATGVGTALRLDAWVMRRSWSPWETIGYEVKVSRQDFQRDQKWVDYLAVCHKFYFVCTRGLIEPADLVPGVGLIWMTDTGNRLVTKVPAQRREPDDAAIIRLLTYVLMSRSVIVSDMHAANEGLGLGGILPRGVERTAAIERHVREAEANGKLAEFVAEHIRKQSDESRKRLAQAEKIEEQIAKFDELLAARGLVWKDKEWRRLDSVVSDAERLAGVIQDYSHLVSQGRSLARSLEHFAASYEKVKR